MQEEQDMVHEPPHYQFGKFSARMIIELVGKTYKSASVFYHVGNALKYLMRAPRKNGLEDLNKAKQSVEFAIENWEGKHGKEITSIYVGTVVQSAYPHFN